MFTGIIEAQGQILSQHWSDGSLRMRLQTGMKDLIPGESVSVNGVCLTVTEPNDQGECTFFLSPETLEKSNLGRQATQSSLNLERALTLQTRLSGHWVQGHVDGIGLWKEAKVNSESVLVQVSIPQRLSRYCVEKGSICINGVSLTINFIAEDRDSSASETRLGITLIPHSWSHTNLSQLKAQDPINIEVDILAKYVERLCRT
ncbi:MAG: riboflavin synthase [Bdellovibrionia bacterium]